MPRRRRSFFEQHRELLSFHERGDERVETLCGWLLHPKDRLLPNLMDLRLNPEAVAEHPLILLGFRGHESSR